MAITNWIDELAKRVAAEIDDPNGRSVESFYLFEKANWQESITRFPAMLSYPTGVKCLYSAGGPCYEIWTGQTEFHVTSDTGKHQYPLIMRYYEQIRNAFAKNTTLGGKVAYLVLRTESQDSISGPVVLTYGSDVPHLGLIAAWVVKEMITLTVS